MDPAEYQDMDRRTGMSQPLAEEETTKSSVAPVLKQLGSGAPALDGGEKTAEVHPAMGNDYNEVVPIVEGSTFGKEFSSVRVSHLIPHPFSVGETTEFPLRTSWRH